MNFGPHLRGAHSPIQARPYAAGYSSLFFQVAAVRHLGCDWAHLDHPQRVLGGVYHCAKFGYDRCSSFGNMNVSIFGTFGWKKPIHAPKIGVWGLDPL